MPQNHFQRSEIQQGFGICDVENCLHVLQNVASEWKAYGCKEAHFSYEFHDNFDFFPKARQKSPLKVISSGKTTMMRSVGRSEGFPATWRRKGMMKLGVTKI